jgi:hypothetical protein
LRIAGTIINGMKPQTIGRVLGIGLRVAGRFAGERLAGQPAAASQPASGPRQVGSATVSGAEQRTKGQTVARATIQASRGVKQGVGGFLRPFQRVGGILWLEVTGVFFLLFALVFGWYMWQSWAVTGAHVWNRSATLSAFFMLVFLYLGASSFWRASKR